MQKLDTKALAASTALVVKEVLVTYLEPINARLKALEDRELLLPEKGDPGEKGEQGEPGESVDAEEVRSMVEEIISEAMEKAQDQVAVLVKEEFAALPPAEKGDKGDKGDPGECGEPGQDADADAIKSDLQAFIASELPLVVEAAVKALPAPEKGDKGDPGEPGRPGEKGEDGSDGVGLAAMFIDREGHAIVTLTDGNIHDLGPIVGKDGTPGEKGEKGDPGNDGREVSDVLVNQEGDIVEFTFKMSDDTTEVYEMTLPAGRDGQDAYPGQAKGAYNPEEEYRAMDVVSFNGSEWRAKIDSPGELPGPDWMLSARIGKRGEKGEPGKPGSDGASIAAQYIHNDQLITTLTDGTELKTDMSSIINRGE